MKEQKTLIIKLDLELFEKLDEFVKKNYQTKAGFVRQLINQKLENEIN